jgi:hypothetical protein
MATASEHKQQARHNREFLETIEKTRFPDWAATVIFYTAVHLVQMLFASKGGRGGSHMRRNQTLRQHYPGVWKHYQPLYSYSRLSRYWCMKVRPSDVPYLERRLGRIERAIEELVA